MKLFFTFITFFCLFTLSAQSSGNYIDGKNEVSSFSEKKATNQVSIFPNPALNFTNVSVVGNSGLKIKSIIVHNILGNQVLFQNYTGASIKLNIIKLKKGRYFVKVLLSDNTTKVLHLLKA